MADSKKEIIKVNGQDVEMETRLIDGVTYVAMRQIAEALNVEVSYDKDTKTKTLTTRSNNSNDSDDVENPEPSTKPVQPRDEKIWLDAGHSKVSRGAVGNGIDEMEYVTYVVLETGRVLEENGFEVGYSRKTFNSCNGATTLNKDLNNRCALANEFKADLFVSVHNNCFSNSSANGIETLVYDKDTAESIEVAKIVQQDLVKGTGMSNRGLKYRPDLAVLRETNMTAILVELGFLSNVDDTTKLKSKGCQQKLGRIIANSIIKFFS